MTRKDEDGLRLIISIMVVILGLILALVADLNIKENWVIGIATICVSLPSMYWYVRATKDKK